MKAPETILSVAKQNRTLQWLTVILALTISALVVCIVFRPVAPVWIITANGTIHRGDREILNWEPLETSRRALEILFVPTENRETLVDAFFAEGLRASIKAHQANDRFISFQIKKVANDTPGKISVDGVLQRVDKPPLAMTVVLIQSPRTELNPFGLVVAQGTFDEPAQR